MYQFLRNNNNNYNTYSNDYKFCNVCSRHGHFASQCKFNQPQQNNNDNNMNNRTSNNCTCLATN